MALQLLLVDAELAHVAVRLLVALLERAQVGLARVALLLLRQLLVRYLQRYVTVPFLGPVPEDEIRRHLDHRHGVRGAVLREHRRHSDLPADQTLRHGELLRCLPPIAPTTVGPDCPPAGEGPDGPEGLQPRAMRGLAGRAESHGNARRTMEQSRVWWR